MEGQILFGLESTLCLTVEMKLVWTLYAWNSMAHSQTTFIQPGNESDKHRYLHVIFPCPHAVCAENHVRTWTVTRFRGRISTQPGSNPVASFKVLSLEGAHSLFYPINSIGELHVIVRLPLLCTRTHAIRDRY